MLPDGTFLSLHGYQRIGPLQCHHAQQQCQGSKQRQAIHENVETFISAHCTLLKPAARSVLRSVGMFISDSLFSWLNSSCAVNMLPSPLRRGRLLAGGAIGMGRVPKSNAIPKLSVKGKARFPLSDISSLSREESASSPPPCGDAFRELPCMYSSCLRLLPCKGRLQ